MNERRSLRDVIPVAMELRQKLLDVCSVIEMAGSARRAVPFVKDVELVAIGGEKLRARLDSLVVNGTIDRALYGDERRPRWGDKHRGWNYKGIRFEIFLTDHDSWGYQYWLRTGPGDANQYVMTQMVMQRAPYRFKDGALWLGDRRVAVRQEADLFKLLGMPYILPEQRTIEVYQRYLKKAQWMPTYALPLVDVRVEELPTQGKLF